MKPEAQDLIDRLIDQLERRDFTNPYFKEGDEEKEVRLKIEEIKVKEGLKNKFG